MGRLSNLAEAFGIKLPFASTVKEAKFHITEFVNDVEYEKLLESDQYFDQYIGWTYKAIHLKAIAAAGVEPRLYKKTTKARTDEIPFDDSQLLKDLFRFNAEHNLNEARFVIHAQLGLTGICFVYIANGVQSKDFYILNPERFSVVVGPNGLPVAYKFEDVDGNIKEISRSNLLIFRNPNPKNWIKGWSPVFASMYAHNSWEYAMQFNMYTFANSGKMQGILTFDGISKTERTRIERKLKDKYQGVKNSGKIMVSNSVPNWIPMGATSQDLQFIDGLKLMREEILSIHGVPEPLAVSSSTYNNVAEAKKIFAEYTTDPALKAEASVWTEQLIPRYYPKGSLEVQKLYIAFPSTVPVDLGEVTTSFEKGTIKLNEARRLQNLDDDPINGDKYSWELKPTTVTSQPVNNTISEDKTVKRLEKKIKELTQTIEGIPSISEQKLIVRENVRSLLLKRIEDNEKKFQEVADKFFKGQEQRILDSTKRFKAPTTAIDLNLADEIAIAISTFEKVYEELAVTFNAGASELAGNGEKPLSDKAKKKLQKELEYFANEINKTTKEDLQRILNDAIETSLGLEDTKDQIKDLFDRYREGSLDTAGAVSMSRIETIARTETNKIKSYVSFDRFKSDEDIVGYEWLATGGRGSRETHNDVDGKIIKKGEKFEVGGEMMRYPHDSSASAKNIVNCRCDILPVFDI